MIRSVKHAPAQFEQKAARLIAKENEKTSQHFVKQRVDAAAAQAITELVKESNKL